MTEHTLSPQQVEAALKDIDQLAQKEYGLPLAQLLKSDDAGPRMQRLAGVILKKPFAEPKKPGPYNPTGASRSWHWDAERLDNPALAGTPEHELLKQLRDAQGGHGWGYLLDVTHEAGLMYVVGKWLKARMDADPKSFRQCYYEPTSPEVDLVLNVANLLPYASALAGLVGAPVLAVNLALILAKFGYEKLTDPPPQPEP